MWISKNILNMQHSLQEESYLEKKKEAKVKTEKS